MTSLEKNAYCLKPRWKSIVVLACSGGLVGFYPSLARSQDLFAQVPQQSQEFIVAENTNLPPFVAPSGPEIISSFQVPLLEDGKEKNNRNSIVRVPGSPQQFFLADTRLAPFGNSANLDQALINSQLPSANFNRPVLPQKNTVISQNVPNAPQSVSQGQISSEDLIPPDRPTKPETLTAQELLSQESIERNLNPTPPQPTLEQQTAPDPLEQPQQ